MPVLPPRITTDASKTIRRHFAHQAEQWNEQNRIDLGVAPDDAMPHYEKSPYPKAFYSTEFLTGKTDVEKMRGFKQVSSQAEEDELTSDPDEQWFHELKEAKDQVQKDKETLVAAAKKK